MTWLSFSEGRHDIGRFELEQFNLARVCYRLAHVNRINGDVGSYSVAQHSLLVASILPPERKLDGLLHDMHEAYIGDITTPIKLFCPEVTDLEFRYQDQIDEAFGIETRCEEVYNADRAVLAAEALHFGLDTDGWMLPRPAPVKIRSLEPLYVAANLECSIRDEAGTRGIKL